MNSRLTVWGLRNYLGKRRSIAVLLTIFVVGFSSPQAATVDDDLTFGGTGTVVKAAAAGQWFFVAGLQPLPDGGVVAAITHQSYSLAISRPALLVFNEDGSDDLTFGTAGLATIELPDADTMPSYVSAITRSATTGDFYVSGFSAYSPIRLFLARINAQGQLQNVAYPGASTFTHSISGSVMGLHVLPDGKVLYVGLGESLGTPWVVLARFNADGSVDESYSVGGGATVWRPVEPGTAGLRINLFGTTQDISGRVFIMLTATNADGYDQDVLVARLDADGIPDPTYRDGGAWPILRPSALGPGLLNLSTKRRAVFGLDTNSDNIFVGLESGSNGLVYLMRLSAVGNGVQDITYGSGLSGASQGVSARIQHFCGATFTADGNVILAGNHNAVGSSQWRFAAWDANGAPLNEDGFVFGTKQGNFLTPADTFAPCDADLRLDSQGRVLIGGTFQHSAGSTAIDGVIARFTADDTPPPPEPGRLRFETDLPPPVAENPAGASVTLRVLREGGSAGVVTVDFRLVAETATEGADFGPATPASGTLTFADGVTEQLIVVTIQDDDSIESQEAFRVELYNATGGAELGSPNITTAQIIDNEAGFDLALSFGTPDFVSGGPDTTIVVYKIVIANQFYYASPQRDVRILFPPDLVFLNARSGLGGWSGELFGTFDPTPVPAPVGGGAFYTWTVPPLESNQLAELRLETSKTLVDTASGPDTGGFVELEASISLNFDDANPDNDEAALSVPIGGDDLAVSVTSPKTSYGATEYIPFEVQISRQSINAAQRVHATGVELILEVQSDNDVATASNTNFTNARTTGTTCMMENAGRRLRCDIGDLASPRVLPIDVHVEGTGTEGRKLRFTATVSTATFDPVPGNNVDELAVSVKTAADGTPTIRGSDCFIATAAYGSWLDPHVATLRSFRDRWLLTNAPGRAFVSWYYRTSPPIADWIAEREWARAVVRAVLAPFVLAVAYPFAALGVFPLFLLAFATRKRLRRRGIDARNGELDLQTCKVPCNAENTDD